ncbi:MAG: 23S rRNA pseudouridine(955/2504/2580) synthase RluC [Pseudomonadota bacterium]
MAESIALSQFSKVQHLIVDSRCEGQRLDNFLLRELKGVPKTRLYRAIRKGEIRVNKGRVKADYRMVLGDSVRIPPLHLTKRTAPAALPRYWTQELARRIIYEDDNVIAIDKPSGLAVHGGSGLSFGLIEGLRQLRPDDRALELVHRLDRDTSGVLLLSRRRSVLRELHRQLRENLMDKRYIALVGGRWPAHVTRVDAPLLKNVLKSGERMVRVAKEGKRSLTQFSVINRFEGATLIEAKPVTGRTHQIRVHAKQAGYPILGDEKYGSDREHALCAKLGLRRLFLHAQSLRLNLPDVGVIELQADLDSELDNTLSNLSK